MSEEIYWLWLSAQFYLGSRRQNELLAHFGSARALFNAPETMLRAGGATDANLAALLPARNLDQTEEMLRVMERNRIAYVSRENAAFPSLLRAIPDPPVGLFVMGELPPDDWPKAAIIGSRRCSEYGLTATRLITKPLGARRVAVVSGMARGIDAAAHRAVLDGGGRTVAVLGCGIDICYPPEHRALRDEIIQSGCVISEYPPGTEPRPFYFPARNRIISGLCQVTVVVEAARKSGTLITVAQAQDQGRDVCAVPGSILSPLSEGTNRLILDGAPPVVSYADILLLLGVADKAPDAGAAVRGGITNALAPDEKRVYDCLSLSPVPFDDLAVSSGLTPPALHYACTLLELKGFAKKLPGLRYIRNI